MKYYLFFQKEKAIKESELFFVRLMKRRINNVFKV